MSKHALEIKVSEQDGVTTIRPDGSIDAASADQLKARVMPLCAQEGARILLDCTRLDHINSLCMAQLSIYHKTCNTNGGTFALYGVDEKILHVFKLIRLDEVLAICATREEALEAVN